MHSSCSRRWIHVHGSFDTYLRQEKQKSKYWNTEAVWLLLWGPRSSENVVNSKVLCSVVAQSNVIYDVDRRRKWRYLHVFATFLTNRLLKSSVFTWFCACGLCMFFTWCAALSCCNVFSQRIGKKGTKSFFAITMTAMTSLSWVLQQCS